MHGVMEYFLQGGQIKTRPLSSTVQMSWAFLPKRLCNYRMLPKFIGIWQDILLTALTDFEKHAAYNYYYHTMYCNHIFILGFGRNDHQGLYTPKRVYQKMTTTSTIQLYN